MIDTTRTGKIKLLEKKRKMETERIVDLDKLERVIGEVVDVFSKNKLNEIDITLVLNELVRVNRSYSIIRDSKSLGK
jgi:CRISPR/Cas system-associated endonuclease Cas3-HD